jgi:hypothetical protein
MNKVIIALTLPALLASMSAYALTMTEFNQDVMQLQQAEQALDNDKACGSDRSQINQDKQRLKAAITKLKSTEGQMITRNPVICHQVNNKASVQIGGDDQELATFSDRDAR